MLATANTASLSRLSRNLCQAFLTGHPENLEIRLTRVPIYKTDPTSGSPVDRNRSLTRV